MDYNKIMKSHFNRLSLLLVLSACLGGCSTHSVYYWGDYESLIYTQYQEPGKALPEYQIEKLQADIQRAKGVNKPLPPGFYAHLGHQYLQIGKTNEARQCFEIEKNQFPESATLMDRFLKKLK